MNQIEVLNKIAESIDFSIRSAELRKESVEPNSKDYYTIVGEMTGLGVSKTLVLLAIKMCQ